MQPKPVVFLLILLTLVASLAVAQHGPTRIPKAIDDTNLIVLKSNTHPLARPEFDRGPAPLNLPFDRMILVLRRRPEQEAALELLLSQQQSRSSPNYHAWLTPEQFGQQFGPADQDIQRILSWLGSHGFQVNGAAKGRTIIEFSGTAGQVKEAFRTEIHKYEVNGAEHWANSTDPKIPTALTPVIAGIASLNNFGRRPQYHIAGVFSRRKDTGRYQPLPPLSPESPLFERGTGCGLATEGCNGVGPYDFATIYNVLPLWNATSPIDGTGQTIAIVSQSDIYPQDFSNFRSDFDLPPATLNMIQNGPDPGHRFDTGDELESDLDVEWSGAVAKGATIDLVISASTNTSAGVDLSALYIVDNNLAPVMSDSYGACELDMGTAANQFYNQLWQQAAAEGITVFVSAGDSGSAVCDQNYPIATQGLAVNGLSSTPYDVAVGGTDFNDLQNQSLYWSSTNNPVTLASAISYIPETTWNDSCTNSEFFPFTGETDAESDCNDTSSVHFPSFLAPVAGSGGASSCTISSNQLLSSCAGGYAKPSWQTGTGVPNDGKRDVPDVSLYAGDGLTGSFYLVCETDLYGGCAGSVIDMIGIGGTSASAPAFAGIMAMVNQKTQSRQGNANYVFYPLAAQPGASCDSSGTIGSSCIFYDVTVGTIAMPCETGTPNCVTNINGDQFGVLSGYSTTAGYDLATGLGSVNVANLVDNWNSVNLQPTISSLSLSPTNPITHGSPVNFNFTVAPETGTGTPTGQVSLLTSTGPVAGTFTLTNGSVFTATGLLPGGSYTVTGHYAGDGTYAASDSSPAIPVTVNPEPSTTTVQAFTLDQKGNATPFTAGPYGGSVVFLSATVAGQSGEGVPTGAVNYLQTLNGTTTNLPGDPYTLNSEAFTMTPLPQDYAFFTPGMYSIAAAYTGDSSFKPNTSPAINFTITQAPTTTTTSTIPCGSSGNPCLISFGTSITIFASVNSGALPPSTLPTGTMTFYSNGTQMGPPLTLDIHVIPPTVTFTGELPVGSDNFTVQYSGDTNFMPSTSAAILFHVGTFTLTANPTAITVASPGQSGSTTLTFTAQYGLSGSVALDPSMCSNLPPQSYCSFNPSTVNLTSSATTVPVALTITTTVPGSSGYSARFTPGPWPGFREIAGVFLLGVCLVLLEISRRRCWNRIVALVALAVIVAAIGCGSGGGGGSGGGNPGTPAGNYTGVTVTVTINGITQTINNLSVYIE